MHLHIKSDLHIDFYADYGMSWCKGLKECPDTTLIIAGDLMEVGNGTHYSNALEIICSKYENVVLVLGNHEFWHSTTWKVNSIVNKIQNKLSNLHVLQNNYVDIGHKIFYGGTLWYPNLGDEHFADFHAIKEFTPWVYKQNKDFKKYLFSFPLADDPNKDLIVVSHHLPSFYSIHDTFKNYTNNHFFCDDLTTKIKELKPKLWVHGHTHHPFDYMLGDTRVYCNPKGYPSEGTNPDFENRMEIEI